MPKSVPELGVVGIQDRAVGIHFRPPTEHAIEFEEHSEGGVQHFRRARTSLGLTGPLTLTNYSFLRFRILQNFTFGSLRPRGNPKTPTGRKSRENASGNIDKN